MPELGAALPHGELCLLRLERVASRLMDADLYGEKVDGQRCQAACLDDLLGVIQSDLGGIGLVALSFDGRFNEEGTCVSRTVVRREECGAVYKHGSGGIGLPGRG